MFRNAWSLLAAIALIGLWHGLGYARETSVAALTHQQSAIHSFEDTPMVSWIHYLENGGQRTITVTFDSARELGLSFEEAVDWFEARWPANSPPN